MDFFSNYHHSTSTRALYMHENANYVVQVYKYVGPTSIYRPVGSLAIQKRLAAPLGTSHLNTEFDREGIGKDCKCLMII